MKKFVFATLLSCITVCSYAQLGLIDYGQNQHIMQFPDTVLEGTLVDSAYVSVVNNSPTQTFIGAITLNIYLDTTGPGNPNIFLKTKTLGGNNIPPGGFVNISLDSLFINVTPYKYGNGNVVVVWPIAVGWQTEDTGRHEVYVKHIIGFAEYDMHTVHFYPNPVTKNSLLYFDSQTEEVQVFSLDGKLVYESINTPLAPLQVSSFASGTYLVRMRKGHVYKQLKLLVLD